MPRGRTGDDFYDTARGGFEPAIVHTLSELKTSLRMKSKHSPLTRSSAVLLVVLGCTLNFPGIGISANLPLLGSWPGYPHGGNAQSVHLVGDYAFVDLGEGGLQVINVANPSNLARVGAVGSDTENGRVFHLGLTPLAHKEDYLYAGRRFSDGIVVIDIRDPQTPQFVGTVGSHPVRAVAIHKNWAFIGTEHNNSVGGISGIEIFDISAADSPVLVNHVETLGHAITALAVIDDVLFASEYSGGHEGAGGLLAFDVSTPSSPVQISRLAPQYDLGRVAVVDDTHVAVVDSVYVENQQPLTHYLQIVDVSEPTNPVRIGSVEIDNLADISVDGDYVFVTSEKTGLQIIDIANRTDPQVVGTIVTPDTAWDVALADHRAYVADGRTGLQIVDISVPAVPTLLSPYAFGAASDVAVDGGLAFVADGYAGLTVIDIGKPGDLNKVGSIEVGDAVGSVEYGDDVVILGGEKGLYVVDVQTPENPQVLATYQTLAPVGSVAYSEGVVYAAEFEAGLEIIDIRDPFAPLLLGRFEPEGMLTDVAVAGSHAYVIELMGAPDFYSRFPGSIVSIVDLSDPSNPRLVGSYRHYEESGWTMQDIALSGGLAYVTLRSRGNGSYARYGGLVVLDINDPENPQLVSQVPGVNKLWRDQGEAFGVAVAKGHVIVGVSEDYSFGLRIFNIADPTLPLLSGSWTHSSSFRSPAVTVVGDRAYVAAAENGLSVIDLTPVLAMPRIVQQGQVRTVNWNAGDLQFSPSVSGPWTDLPVASPLNLQTIGEKGFFRVKVEE